MHELYITALLSIIVLSPIDTLSPITQLQPILTFLPNDAFEEIHEPEPKVGLFTNL